MCGLARSGEKVSAVACVSCLLSEIGISPAASAVSIHLTRLPFNGIRFFLDKSLASLLQCLALTTRQGCQASALRESKRGTHGIYALIGG